MIFFFFQAEDGIRDYKVTEVQTCALPISPKRCVSQPVSGTEMALATPKLVITQVPWLGLTATSPEIAGMATLAMDESSTFMKVASDRASVPRASWAPLSGAGRAGMAGGAEGGAAGGTVGPPGCADSGTAVVEEVIGSPRRFWEGGEAMPAYLDCVACASTGAEATAAGALPCALSCASAMATGGSSGNCLSGATFWPATMWAMRSSAWGNAMS